MKLKTTAVIMAIILFATSLISIESNAATITQGGTSQISINGMIGSTFQVTLPSEFKLTNNGVSEFNILTEGDIADNQKLTLEIATSVTLTSDRGENKAVSVSADKTEFSSSELSLGDKSTVSCTTPKLSAGKWEGSLTVNIGVEADTSVKEGVNVLGFGDMAEFTQDGVTVSIEDNLITLNGTAEKDTDINFTSVLISDALTSGSTYTFAYKPISGTKTTSQEPFLFYYTGQDVVTVKELGTTQTLGTDQTRAKIKLRSNDTFNNYKFYLYAVTGSEYKHYVPYGEESGTSGGEVDMAVFNLEVSDTVNKVNSYKTAGNTVNFAMLSDTHVYPNYDQNDSSTKQYASTIANIKAVNDATRMDGLVHLGDYVNTQWLWTNHTITNDVYHTMINKYAKQLKDTGINNMYLVAGNHDADFKPNADSSGTEYTMYSSLYSNIGSVMDATTSVQRPDWTDGVKAPYYYTDYDSAKVRCIFLCTNQENPNNDVKGIPYNEVTWFKSVLESLPTDYDVLLFGHIPMSIFYSDVAVPSSATDSFIAIANGFNEGSVVDLSGSSLDCDFTGNTSKILAYFTGHYHGDRIVYPNDVRAVLNFPEVTIASSSYIYEGVINSGDYYDNADLPQREYGTVTQDAFDILTYSPNEKKIYITRFGAGVDRVVNIE